MSTDKFQLTGEHNQAQNNIFEVYSLVSHSSNAREFNVRTFIVDLAEYIMCSLHSWVIKDTCKPLH